MTPHEYKLNNTLQRKNRELCTIYKKFNIIYNLYTNLLIYSSEIKTNCDELLKDNSLLNYDLLLIEKNKLARDLLTAREEYSKNLLKSDCIIKDYSSNCN